MTETSPILLWLRRDLRLADHPALTAAAATGRPVIPVFILDEVLGGHGAAPLWRLGLGVERFAEALAARGSRLILRRGRALDVIRSLLAETGAGAVYWSRLYDPASIARDKAMKAASAELGIEARSFAGHLLFEPWEVETKAGGPYKVFTPFWNAVRQRTAPALLAPPTTLQCPDRWPDSDDLAAWNTGAAMGRGAKVVRPFTCVGEAAAMGRLDRFVDERVGEYREARDRPGVAGTSGLSENLTYGEISPRRIWQAGQRALATGAPGAETFLKELVWREFAYHLMFHTPHILTDNWREDWSGFPWRMDAEAKAFRDWRQGRTGIRFVDAAMRELWVTGTMHNRSRMIAASYLTKHLLTHWKLGLAWFEHCLIDWDPASNAMGWQWVAGSGPDASPYFRIFNPDTQLHRFDPSGAYPRRWIAEEQTAPPETALAFFRAVPRSWNLSPQDPYPDAAMPLDVGRRRALDAYANRAAKSG